MCITPVPLHPTAFSYQRTYPHILVFVHLPQGSWFGEPETKRRYIGVTMLTLTQR